MRGIQNSTDNNTSNIYDEIPEQADLERKREKELSPSKKLKKKVLKIYF